MGMQIVLAKSKQRQVFKEGDPEFEYGRRYFMFGIYDPVGVIPKKPDQLFARWLKMVNYCRKKGYTPVAVFAVDNPSLSRLCQRLGMLTVGASRDSQQRNYNKVVMDENLLLECDGIYYFEVPSEENLDKPDIIQKAEEKEIDIYTITGAEADTNSRTTTQVDPTKVVHDLPPHPDRIPKDPYAEFPLDDLMEQFVQPADDQSLPLEMPEGLKDFTKL